MALFPEERYTFTRPQSHQLTPPCPLSFDDVQKNKQRFKKKWKSSVISQPEGSRAILCMSKSLFFLSVMNNTECIN